MKYYFHLIIHDENNYIIENDFPLLIEKVKKKIKYFLRKVGIFIVFILLLITSKNFDFDFLSNELLLAKKKKFHYFIKYFKNISFTDNHSSQLKFFSLFNEVIYLHNIRKEIKIYKDINFSNNKLFKIF